MKQPRAWTTWVFAIAAIGFAAAPAAAGPTFVIDFKEAGSSSTTAITGDTVGAFDAAAYGFATSTARATLIDSVMTALRSAFYDIPTANLDNRSPIPQGKQLDVDFVTGTIGQAPSNGATEYYYVQVGSGINGTSYNGGALGVAGVSSARNAGGNPGVTGSIVASIFTNTIVGMGGLTPTNALTSGNLSYATYAIEGTLAHEIGHTLSLAHERVAGAITPNGLNPLLGTGAIDLPNQARIFKREFSYTSKTSGGAEQHHIAQLVGALGLRDQPTAAVPEPAALAQAGIAAAIAAGAFLTRRRRRLAA